jgi:hypothetical protein
MTKLNVHTVPRFHRRCLCVPSPQPSLRLAVNPAVRIDSSLHGETELLVPCLLFRSVGQVERDAVLKPGLLDGLGTLLPGAFIRLQGQGNFLSRGDVRQENAKRRSILDSLGGALRDIRPSL